MKALTITQPWSYAIAHLGKRIENRMWHPPREMLGQTIAIHAGKKGDLEAVQWIKDYVDHRPALPSSFVFGAVESVARLVDVICISGRTVQHLAPNDLSLDIAELVDSVWFQGPFGWVFSDVIALPKPVPCRGYQKLWDLPSDVEANVLEQMRASTNPLDLVKYDLFRLASPPKDLSP